jgi:hypothetical protein
VGSEKFSTPVDKAVEDTREGTRGGRGSRGACQTGAMGRLLCRVGLHDWSIPMLTDKLGTPRMYLVRRCRRRTCDAKETV